MAMHACLNQAGFEAIHARVLAQARDQVEEGGFAPATLHTFRLSGGGVQHTGGLALEGVPADWTTEEIRALLHTQVQLPYVDAAAFSARAWALDITPIVADLAGILAALYERAAPLGTPLAAFVNAWQKRACSEPAAVADELGRILVQEAGGVGNLPVALRRETLIITVAAADREYCWLHGIEHTSGCRLLDVPWHDPFAGEVARPAPFSLALVESPHS